LTRRNNKLSKRVDGVILNQSTMIGGDLKECLDLFVQDCIIRNLSEHTIKSYKSELNSYRKILEEQEVDPAPSKITSKIIRENIILYMREKKGAKDVTVNTRLRTLRAFFNYLFKEQYILRNPFDEVSLIKQKRTIIPTFTVEQLQAILRQPDLSTFTGVRDYTMILLLIETGIRAKELVGIKVDDIKWEDSTIHIRDAKGYKERLVPIQATMKKQLKDYLRVRGQLSEEDALFINIDNEPLSKRQLQSRIADYGKKAQVRGVRCSPHTFRHTFAKLSVKGGAGIFELQQILGHTSMEMVKIYVNLFSEDVKDKHRKFSPLKQL
jgi:integrase/recombinase XerD